MPKPGKYSKPPSWKSQYNEHDFRSNNDGPTGNNRRVSFKQNRHSGGKGTNKDWGFSLKAHLEEEDIDMGNTSYANAKIRKGGPKKKGRQGSPPPNRMGGSKGRLLEAPNNWYRVTLPYGFRYDKEFIIKTLLEAVQPLEFIPISWYVNGSAVTFYVDNYTVASKLYSIDRDFKYPDGYRIIIKVYSGTPNVDLNAQLKEKMKLVMAKRYNLPTKALDLTKFHLDPDLRDSFCALSKPIIFNAVIEIMAENIPDVEALNLHDNKIMMFNHLKNISKQLPNLKILHMGNNKIRDVSMLDPLSGLKILDLVLDGNPLCDRFKDKDKYISEIRKRFPKVIKLDGLDLPPPIKFDLEEEIPLPNSQQTFLCNQEGQIIVRQFLEQYFELFDSNNRKELLNAYHENASFSMTMNYPYGYNQKISPTLAWYSTDNRNLLRVQDPERRSKLLRQGQMAIVSFLQEMPATKHDMHSFTVDLTVFVPQMMVLTVSGLFKEVRSGLKNPPLRYFLRTLVIVPAGSGFCISNEEIHISNATEEQIKVAFKTPIPVPVAPVDIAPVPAVTATSPVVPSIAAVTPIVTPEIQQQMVKAMSEQSGMNLEWSHKCLEESGWDYQKAAYVFTELNKLKQIPAEAFIK